MKRKPFALRKRKQATETWLYTYADMMSFIVSFFVLIVTMVGVSDEQWSGVAEQVADSFSKGAKETPLPEDESESARQERAFRMLMDHLGLEQDMDEIIRAIEKLHTLQTTIDLKEHTRPSMAQLEAGIKQVVRATGTNEKVISLQLPSSVLFDSGQAVLKKRAHQRIHILAREIKSQAGVTSIHVRGHTDSQPVGSGRLYPNNFALSAARAGAVAQALMDAGIPAELLTTSGLANLQPLFPEKDGAGRWLSENLSRNRRVEIEVRTPINF